MAKNNHGGYRPGSGRKPLKNKKVSVSLSVAPEVIFAFKKKWGRKWNRRTEELMRDEIKDIP